MDKAFVDTGPLFEFGAAQDATRFAKARELLLSSDYQWYSSTYIFDELMTLLSRRTDKKRAIVFGEKLRSSRRMVWLHPSADEEEAAWHFFRTHKDQRWSFTDCLSTVLIKRYRIQWAFSFDRDFVQMGLPLL